jgi:DNA-binding response OmpR family regulator
MTHTILVLEDEVWIATNVAEILAEFAFQVCGPFRSNAEALRCLGEHKVDAAILDFEVADGTCKQTAARLINLRIPFLVSSGYEKDIASEHLFQFAPWLCKPYGEAALIGKLTSLLPQKI